MKMKVFYLSVKQNTTLIYLRKQLRKSTISVIMEILKNCTRKDLRIDHNTL